jgi:Flp pilus assembly protein TadD
MSMRKLAVLLGVLLLQLSCQHVPRTVGEVSPGVTQGAITDDRKGAPSQDGQRLEHAKELLADGKFEEAISVLQQEIAHAHQQLQPQLLLAGAYLESGKTGPAEQLLTIVLTTWPGNPEATLLLGFVFLAQGEKHQALQPLQRAIQLTDVPEHHLTAHLGLAAAYEGLGEQPQADHHYAQALAIEPRLRPVLMNIQKSLLWRQPVVTTGTDIGHPVPDPGRRERIEAELKKLRGEKQ